MYLNIINYSFIKAIALVLYCFKTLSKKSLKVLNIEIIIYLINKAKTISGIKNKVDFNFITSL